MKLSRALLVTALHALGGLPAATLAHATVLEDQRAAVIIEWYAANCGLDGLPVEAVSVSQLMISGSKPSELERLRAEVQNRMDERFSDHQAACADLKAAFNRP